MSQEQTIAERLRGEFPGEEELIGKVTGRTT